MSGQLSRDAPAQHPVDGDVVDPRAQHRQQIVLVERRANACTVRSLGGRPIDALDRDLASMTVLPPHPPTTGLQARVRLGRDYYVRVDSNDYSVDPRVIGRLVDVTATLTRVIVVCDGTAVADHERS